MTVLLPVVGLCLVIGLFATRLTARVWLLMLLGIVAVLAANLPR